MITKMSCNCGNNKVHRAYEYEGLLGYEAIVYLDCGRYFDYTGTHEPDNWSQGIVSDYSHRYK